jgi:hypothetical protein
LIEKASGTFAREAEVLKNRPAWRLKIETGRRLIEKAKNIARPLQSSIIHGRR